MVRQGIDFAVLLLQSNYTNPVKSFYPMYVEGSFQVDCCRFPTHTIPTPTHHTNHAHRTLDESAQYWLRGCREEQGPPVEIGFGTSTAVDIRVSPILSPIQFFLALRRIGDITGNGHPEVLVQYVARAPPPRGNLEKALIFSPLYKNFRCVRCSVMLIWVCVSGGNNRGHFRYCVAYKPRSQTPKHSHVELAGFLGPPETYLSGFSLWSIMREETVAGGVNKDKGLLPTRNMTYAFRVHPDPDMSNWVVDAMEIPLPMNGRVPLRTAQEAELLVFKQPVRCRPCAEPTTSPKFRFQLPMPPTPQNNNRATTSRRRSTSCLPASASSARSSSSRASAAPAPAPAGSPVF